MFLGDGLSVPTLAATRAYLGQSQGKPGEETVLSFEEFPNTGLSKVSDTRISRQLNRATVR
jgi:alkaline phosphatase